MCFFFIFCLESERYDPVCLPCEEPWWTEMKNLLNQLKSTRKIEGLIIIIKYYHYDCYYFTIIFRIVIIIIIIINNAI